MELWSIISDIVVGLMTIIGSVYITKISQIRKENEQLRSRLDKFDAEHTRVKDDIIKIEVKEENCKKGIYEKLNNQADISNYNKGELKNISSGINELNINMKDALDLIHQTNNKVIEHAVRLDVIDRRLEKISKE